MADAPDKRSTPAAGVPQVEGHGTGQLSGQYGVSDERRAQLSQMEQDAGVQHEAADESVTQQSEASQKEAAGLAAERAAARPRDRH